MGTVRKLLVLLILVGAAMPMTAAAGAPPDDGETAEDAARKIAEARERVNAASEAWEQAQFKLDLLTEEKGRLDLEVVDLQGRADELQRLLEKAAVNRYISAGSTGLPLLTGTQEPMERAESVMLTAIIHEESAVTMDDYDVVLDHLADKLDEAEHNERELRVAEREPDLRRDEAVAEVERLKLVERDRLNNEAVMQAIEAQRQEQIEAQERLSAEKLKFDQAATLQAELATGSDGGDEGYGHLLSNQISGASAGGTTGGGGSGGMPADGNSIIYGNGEEWVCPVQQGVISFSNSWGDPRSGGRFHQGVDLISRAGLPVVAVVDGQAIPKTNLLGGITVSLIGDDHHRYYYAHLLQWGQTGIVEKGTVIGWVGQTGNAIYSTAHLHFEIHPNGGAAVNPYATVRANCDPSIVDVLPPSTGPITPTDPNAPITPTAPTAPTEPTPTTTPATIPAAPVEPTVTTQPPVTTEPPVASIPPAPALEPASTTQPSTG